MQKAAKIKWVNIKIKNISVVYTNRSEDHSEFKPKTNAVKHKVITELLFQMDFERVVSKYTLSES